MTDNKQRIWRITARAPMKAGTIIGFALLSKYVFEPIGGIWPFLNGLF